MDINSIYDSIVTTTSKECSYHFIKDEDRVVRIHGSEKVHLNRYM